MCQIENIQIIKGVGSVVNGFESLTGQINVEYFKSEEDVDKCKWNIYANHSGKLENNLILTKKKGNWNGVDVKEGNVIDLKKEGIIDPTKVTRAALENAASVAGTVLLTECVVVNDPKEKKDDQMAMNPMMGM